MDSEPSWDVYRSFDAVLRAGSLSGAARTLGLTQPTLARHVETLERAVGTPLFLRTPRGLSPTDAALEIAPYAERLGANVAALRRMAESRADEIRGTVRVTASEVVGVEHLPAILAGLRRANPALSFELVLSNAVDDLLERRADIAVRMVQPAQQALLARRVGTLAVGLHAHRDYLARRGVPETFEALAAHDLIGYDFETPAIRALGERFPDLRGLRYALKVDNDVAQLAAIRAGFGIGFCQVVVASRSPGLDRVLPEAFQLDLATWVVMHEDLRGSARYRLVFDTLVRELGRIAGAAGR